MPLYFDCFGRKYGLRSQDFSYAICSSPSGFLLYSFFSFSFPLLFKGVGSYISYLRKTPARTQIFAPSSTVSNLKVPFVYSSGSLWCSTWFSLPSSEDVKSIEKCVCQMAFLLQLSYKIRFYEDRQTASCYCIDKPHLPMAQLHLKNTSFLIWNVRFPWFIVSQDFLWTQSLRAH